MAEGIGITHPDLRKFPNINQEFGVSATSVAGSDSEGILTEKPSSGRGMKSLEKFMSVVEQRMNQFKKQFTSAIEIGWNHSGEVTWKKDNNTGRKTITQVQIRTIGPI